MPHVSYVNGRYLPHRAATVHIEDRGHQFADGVYEVIAICDGYLVDELPHLDRLARSLGELSIDAPMGIASLRHVLAEVVRRNRVRNGMVYLQVTRGVAPRDHAFPERVNPSLTVTARSTKGPPAALMEDGCAVITIPDIRWRRCDIKSVSLLPNVLAKQAAHDAGAFEAWMVDDQGQVTEGSSTNAWIVSAAGALVTRPPDASILNGITRRAVVALADESGLPFEERSFTVDEAVAAREAFITSTTAFVIPVVEIDGAKVGSGSPGSFAQRLLADYRAYVTRSATSCGQ